MKHIPSRTPQIVFIGPNYYVKHICMKVNLDPILEHQMKCESMKACKTLKPNTWDVHFSSKSKFYRDTTKYLIILAMHLFSVVPFVYTWMLACNEQNNKQNKKTQDM